MFRKYFSSLSAGLSVGLSVRFLLSLGLCATCWACADQGDDVHQIPAEAEAEGQLMTLPMALGQAEYGPATWITSPNYTTAWRGKGQIKVIVIHTTQGSFNGSVSWFKNPKAKVSAHYIIGKAGQVVQMVKEKDIAWHVGTANGYTVGIEHEGFVSDPNWVTPKMLDASAKLACYLVKKYGLTATKTHIKGHVELPNQTHTDPGKYWPWAIYLKKVKSCVGGAVIPPTKAGCCALKVKSSGATVIDDKGNNCIQKFGNPNTWWTAKDTGYGGSMVYTYTAVGSWPDNWARWRLSFEKLGKYQVDVWIPAKHAAAVATYRIKHGGVVSTAKVNQKIHSNTWIKLGVWSFKGDCDEWVVLEDNQGVKGVQMGVDAVRVTAIGGSSSCAGGCDDKEVCTADSCESGKCVHVAKTVKCDDGDACTAGDKCVGGQCQGLPKSCDDSNPCTDDYCVNGGCKAKPNKMFCDDGDACTVEDKCVDGACVGEKKGCDDDNPCTDDLCKDGVCSHPANMAPCGAATSCADAPKCLAGVCVAGPSLCDDADPCTKDVCANEHCEHRKIAGCDFSRDRDARGGGAGSADAAGGLSRDGGASGSDASGSFEAQPASSGCSAGRAAAPFGIPWLLLLSLAWLIAWRRLRA